MSLNILNILNTKVLIFFYLLFIYRNIAFFTGAILAVMLGLSFYDQDVLTAEHVISFMATLGEAF